MSDFTSIKAQLQKLIADANTKTERTDADLTSAVGALIEGYGKLPEGTLEGLENGYDVMFYDENNDGLAFYSIKQRHSINPPVYNCKNWQTANGAIITFPYTPNADAIFYALVETYADQLYEFYGIDKGVYPYLYIRHQSGLNYWWVFFGKTKTDNYLHDVMYQRFKNGNAMADATDIPSVIKYVTSIITTLSSADSGGLVDDSANVYYTNFDTELTVSEYYRLDQ